MLKGAFVSFNGDPWCLRVSMLRGVLRSTLLAVGARHGHLRTALDESVVVHPSRVGIMAELVGLSVDAVLQLC
jgi:hypothetical protein